MRLQKPIVVDASWERVGNLFGSADWSVVGPLPHKSMSAHRSAVGVKHTIGKKYLMIAALKQTIAIHAGDPNWTRVRPPLLALDADQRASLERELTAIGFTMPGLTRAPAPASAL